MRILIAALVLGFGFGAVAFPVNKDSSLPNFENGKIWDVQYLESLRRSSGNCHAASEMYPGMKIDIDYPSFEKAFDFEMKKPKVADRSEMISPSNSCEKLCMFISFDCNGLSGEKIPCTQTDGITQEFGSQVKRVVCTYRNPDSAKKNVTHIEYNPKNKTLTGFFTKADYTDWNGFYWASSAYDTPIFQKAFPLVKKWKDSH